MKRYIKLTGVFLLLIIITISIIPKLITNNSTYSFTKAHCTENNYCQDFYVKCQGDKIISLSQTGYSVQHDKNWKDTRENNKINCE